MARDVIGLSSYDSPVLLLLIVSFLLLVSPPLPPSHHFPRRRCTPLSLLLVSFLVVVVSTPPCYRVISLSSSSCHFPLLLVVSLPLFIVVVSLPSSSSCRFPHPPPHVVSPLSSVRRPASAVDGPYVVDGQHSCAQAVGAGSYVLGLVVEAVC